LCSPPARAGRDARRNSPRTARIIERRMWDLLLKRGGAPEQPCLEARTGFLRMHEGVYGEGV
jgi:hypothetical protein